MRDWDDQRKVEANSSIWLEDPDCLMLIVVHPDEVVTSRGSRWGLSIGWASSYPNFHCPPNSGLVFT